MKTSTHVSDHNPQAIRTKMKSADKEGMTATTMMLPSADEGVENASARIWSDEAASRRAANRTPRPFRPMRFAFGLATTTAGMSAFLLVGIRILELRAIVGDFVLPLVGITVLVGIVLLGGGFGLMATAAAGFDEREFEQSIE
jgi:hypothetical protein